MRCSKGDEEAKSKQSRKREERVQLLRQLAVRVDAAAELAALCDDTIAAGFQLESFEGPCKLLSPCRLRPKQGLLLLVHHPAKILRRGRPPAALGRRQLGCACARMDDAFVARKHRGSTRLC